MEYLSAGGDVLPVLLLHGGQRVAGILLTRVQQTGTPCRTPSLHHPYHYTTCRIHTLGPSRRT